MTCRFIPCLMRTAFVGQETIYQVISVQGRGELRRELTRALRTSATTPMVMISRLERPGLGGGPDTWKGEGLWHPEEVLR
jgi:hypothetical protein